MFYGFAAYTTITLIMTYLEYGTSTLVSSIFEAPSSFPKITIFNLNQFTTQFAYEFIQKIDKMNAVSLFNLRLWYKGVKFVWLIYLAAGALLANQTDQYKMSMGHIMICQNDQE